MTHIDPKLDRNPGQGVALLDIVDHDLFILFASGGCRRPIFFLSFRHRSERDPLITSVVEGHICSTHIDEYLVPSNLAG